MKEISATAYAKLSEDLKQLEIDMKETEERMQAALGYGDLSENAEYEAEKTALTQQQALKQKIEQTLRTSRPKAGYSTTITSGTLITIQKVDEQGNVLEDLGLKMFDEFGDILFDGKINPDSNLGRAIEGSTGGVVQVQDLNGNPALFKVTVEPESELSRFWTIYSKNKKDRLKELLSGVTDEQ